MLNAEFGLEDLEGEVREVAGRGLSSVWMAQGFGIDALTALALIGREVPAIELGTAVVPIYPRHPLVLAGQALTTQAACGGRLALGIGVSHRVVIERVYGYSFDRPTLHMREYLIVLRDMIRRGEASFQGDTVRARTLSKVSVPGATPVPLLLAALGPRMLELAGAVGDGTITWMTGPATVAEHTVPLIHAAAANADRPPPRVVVGVPVCVTRNVTNARDQAAERFGFYGGLPSYRAMLDREGLANASDIAVVGDEASVRRQLQRFADAGATDLMAQPFGSAPEQSETLDLLATIH